MEEKLKILVVDDDEVERTAVCLALTKASVDIEVDEANNFKSALAALKNTKFDCIFLDYFLLYQDGFTLIHKFNTLGIKVPVVVLTIPGDEQTLNKLIQLGATDCLVKSQILSDNIFQLIRNVIRIHQAEMKADLAYQQLKESNEQLIRKNQELEKQRQQIQLQNWKLIEASRLKSQFLATISHELRTPMNAIIGFSQILLRPKFGQLTNQQTDMVERILNNGKHLLMLLNEVLDFSKLEAGKLELKAEIFDLSKIVDSTVSEIRSLAEAKKLSLFVKTDLENTLIFNDPVRVRQILINLLANAVKFTDHGSIWIEIAEIPTNCIAISIRDTGIGISAQDIKKIFEAFTQVDQGISRKYPGAGLGLAIINSLVQMMGGKIYIESELGVGSVFKLELPRQIMVRENRTENYNLKSFENDDRIDDEIYTHQNPPQQPFQFNKVSLGYPQ